QGDEQRDRRGERNAARERPADPAGGFGWLLEKQGSPLPKNLTDPSPRSGCGAEFTNRTRPLRDALTSELTDRNRLSALLTDHRGRPHGDPEVLSWVRPPVPGTDL